MHAEHGQTMELRHLRSFVAVADSGSISLAARRLNVTQPALSRQIQDLERDMGVRLFDRIGRRVILTGDGGDLLGRTRRVLADVDAFRGAPKHSVEGRAGYSGSARHLSSSRAHFPRFWRHIVALDQGWRSNSSKTVPIRYSGVFNTVSCTWPSGCSAARRGSRAASCTPCEFWRLCRGGTGSPVGSHSA